MTTTSTTTTIPRCVRCGKRHRTWWRLAKCRWPRATWIVGEGPFASVSRCSPGSTVELYWHVEQAREAKRFIDGSWCGGRCGGRSYHHVIDLDGGGEGVGGRISTGFRR